MYIYIYICIYISIYVYIYMYVYICMNLYMMNPNHIPGASNSRAATRRPESAPLTRSDEHSQPLAKLPAHHPHTPYLIQGASNSRAAVSPSAVEG